MNFEVNVVLNGKTVKLADLSPELQADYLINNKFDYFVSDANKIWRMENLYYITTKNATKEIFKFNAAQKHFVENYLSGNRPYKRLIILKARQLGFTTLIALWFLDAIIWKPNTAALQIAHTLKDAGEIFTRKIQLAVKNFYLPMLDQLHMTQNSAKKLQFEYPDGNGGRSTSTYSVSNSGRSGTFNFLHISELAKLSKLSTGKAEEIVTGTIPALPGSGTIFIESTAEGQSGLFYEMYTTAMERKEFITPELSRVEFYPVFYNWTWDKAEIESSAKQGIIPVSSMKESEIDWADYQKDNKLTDKEISFYYTKYISANEDLDKLHQEYPTTELEAFIGSGSNFFSLRKTAELMNKVTKNYRAYDFLNEDFVLNPYLVQENFEGLIEYESPIAGKNYVIGSDVAEGLQDGDYSVAVILGYDKQIKALYKGKIEPDDFSKLLYNLGVRYNTALLAVEFNKDGNWVNTDLRNSGYSNMYLRTALDDITRQVTKTFGWLTSAKTRPNMLGEAKKHFNSTQELNCVPLLKEIMTFTRNKFGRPAAAYGKHDDIVMSWAIALAVLQNKEEKITQVNSTNVMSLLYS